MHDQLNSLQVCLQNFRGIISMGHSVYFSSDCRLLG